MTKKHLITPQLRGLPSMIAHGRTGPVCYPLQTPQNLRQNWFQFFHLLQLLVGFLGLLLHLVSRSSRFQCVSKGESRLDPRRFGRTRLRRLLCVVWGMMRSPRESCLSPNWFGVQRLVKGFPCFKESNQFSLTLSILYDFKCFELLNPIQEL